MGFQAAVLHAADKIFQFAAFGAGLNWGALLAVS
jgi:hypothetical protein